MTHKEQDIFKQGSHNKLQILKQNELTRGKEKKKTTSDKTLQHFPNKTNNQQNQSKKQTPYDTLHLKKHALSQSEKRGKLYTETQKNKHTYQNNSKADFRRTLLKTLHTEKEAKGRNKIKNGKVFPPIPQENTSQKQAQHCKETSKGPNQDLLKKPSIFLNQRSFSKAKRKKTPERQKQESQNIVCCQEASPSLKSHRYLLLP